MLSSFSEGGLFPTTEAKPKPNSKQNKNNSNNYKTPKRLL